MRRLVVPVFLTLLCSLAAFGDTGWWGEIKIIGSSDEIGRIQTALWTIENNTTPLSQRWKRLMFGGNVKRIVVFNRSNFRRYYGTSRSYNRTWGFFSSTTPHTIYIQSDHVNTSSLADIENTLIHEAVHMAAYLRPDRYSFNYGTEYAVKNYADQYESRTYTASTGTTSRGNVSGNRPLENTFLTVDWCKFSWNTLYGTDMELLSLNVIWKFGSAFLFGLGTAAVREFEIPVESYGSGTSGGDWGSSRGSGTGLAWEKSDVLRSVLPLRAMIYLFLNPSANVRADLVLLAEFPVLNYALDEVPDYALAELQFRFCLVAGWLSFPLTLAAGFFTAPAAVWKDGMNDYRTPGATGFYFSASVAWGVYQ